MKVLSVDHEDPNDERLDHRSVNVAFKELKRNFHGILDAAAEGILGLDRQGAITFLNPSVVTMTGYPAEELIGRDFHQTFHHSKPDGTPCPAIECPLCNAVQAGIPSPMQEELLWRKDGSSFYASYRTMPMEEEGEVMGAVVVMQDVTERRQAEELQNRLEGQLCQAQQMEAIGALAGGIAHEFNNIMGIVLGYAELSWLKAGADSPLGKDLEPIIQAGYRARDLVGQLGALRQRTKPERHPLQVYLIVKEALKLLRASLPTTIQIRSVVTSRANVLADPTQIHQVLMNLCANAAQAMSESGGLLEVKLTNSTEDTVLPPGLLPGPYVQLTVSDTGPGMNPEVMARIFDPAFTTKERGEGTGLGLPVVHSIVTRHQGAVTVSSEPGKGSSFEVFFPRLEDSVEVTAHRMERLATGRERILLVDDDEALARLGRGALQHLGYEVVALADSVEALKLFQQSPGNFDLLVTNQTMPHMTGAQLARSVLSLRPDIPVILCTGYSDMVPHIKALEIGIREYLVKPVGLGELASRVRQVLDEGRS